MFRRDTSAPEPQALRRTTTLQLNKKKVYRPISFLNPTQAHFNALPPGKIGTDLQTTSDAVNQQAAGENLAEEDTTFGIQHKWTSRNNRKGRHALVIRHAVNDDAQYSTPLPTASAERVLKGIWRMFAYFPFWDISYLVAVIFYWGSVIWIINACFVFLPLTNLKSKFPRETLFGGGITAFIGVMVFEIGCALLMLEAVNENRADCFG